MYFRVFVRTYFTYSKERLKCLILICIFRGMDELHQMNKNPLDSQSKILFSFPRLGAFQINHKMETTQVFGAICSVGGIITPSFTCNSSNKLTPKICFSKYHTKTGEKVTIASVLVKLWEEDNHIANAIIISPA